MKISNKNLFIGFKVFSSQSHYLALRCEEMVSECRKDLIFEDRKFPSCRLNQALKNYKSLILFIYNRIVRAHTTVNQKLT